MPELSQRLDDLGVPEADLLLDSNDGFIETLVDPRPQRLMRGETVPEADPDDVRELLNHRLLATCRR